MDIQYLLRLVGLWVASGIVLGQEKCVPTSADVTGPFYKKGAPIKRMLPGVIPNICRNSPVHDRLLLNGTVLRISPGGSSSCGTPVKALLEIWHANYEGVYSDHSALSADYECRAQVVTQNDGFFSFSSLFPGRYDDNGLRPAHIHFRVTALDESDHPISKPLTTQLYFAQDYFLAPRDSCQVCRSGDPTLITHVAHEFDIKTFSGSWRIVLT